MENMLMSKQNKNKHLNIIASKIAQLEKEIILGNNIEENKIKIQNYMCSLSQEDLLYVVNRIESKHLTTNKIY